MSELDPLGEIESAEKEYAVTLKVQNNYLLKRMKLAGFRTVSALAEAAGVSQGELGKLLNLKSTGLRKNEGWRGTVVKVAEVLRCMPQDLIPPNHLRSALAKNTAMLEMDERQVRITMGAMLPQIAESPEKLQLRDEAVEQITSVLSTLAPRDERVIRLRFGLDGKEALTLAEVGKLLGVQQERVRQIEQRALRRMRHPSKSSNLPRPGEIFGDD